MGLIPNARSSQYALLVGIVAIALSYVFYEYWYTPRVEEVEQLQSRLELLQDQNRRAQVLAARGGPELEERLAVYERHLGRMEELIPQRGEVPALLNTITVEATRYGVIMGSLRPEPLREDEFYTRESYQITVIGEFHQVGQFLTSVASLPRIITPVDVEMTPYTGAVPPAGVESPVTVSFRIETYQAPAINGAIPEGLAEEVSR